MLQLRRVTIEDLELIYAWRNDPLVYKYSLNPHPIAKDGHIQWFNRVINSPKVFFFMGVYDGNPCGTVRYDLIGETDEAEVSISISPAFWGKGIAFELMKLAELELQKVSNIKTIHATVLSDNKSSLSLFNKSDFNEYLVKFKKNIGDSKGEV